MIFFIIDDFSIFFQFSDLKIETVDASTCEFLVALCFQETAVGGPDLIYLLFFIIGGCKHVILKQKCHLLGYHVFNGYFKKKN